METATLLLATAVGATTQRVTGMGFALVTSSFFVISLGPIAGIIAVCFCSVVLSAGVFMRTWRDVNWKPFLLLTLFASLLIFPGAWAASRMRSHVLELGVGIVVLAALFLSITIAAWGRNPSSTRGSVAISGAFSGLMEAAAGVGGPAVSAFAVAIRWPQKSFAATLQPYFVVIGSLTIVAKSLISSVPALGVEADMLLLLVLSLFIGICFGEVLSRVISIAVARRAMVGLATTGAIATIVQGVIGIYAT